MDDLDDMTTALPPHNPTDKPQWDLSAIVVLLLKTVVYRDDDSQVWQTLLALQARVRDYVAVLGVELVLDEAEGYAFLRSRAAQDAAADDEDAAQAAQVDSLKIPRLIVRRPLSFHVSLLLALLRKKLAEFDAGGSDTRLILPRDAVVELIRVFLPTGSNESRLIDQVDTHLNKVIELGFVRRLKPQGQGGKNEAMYEVRRILKAFVDAQWLADFDQRLAAYQVQLALPETGTAHD
jgi:Domain of unknown function (DUF4194)